MGLPVRRADALVAASLLTALLIVFNLTAVWMDAPRTWLDLMPARMGGDDGSGGSFEPFGEILVI